MASPKEFELLSAVVTTSVKNFTETMKHLKAIRDEAEKIKKISVGITFNNKLAKQALDNQKAELANEKAKLDIQKKELELEATLQKAVQAELKSERDTLAVKKAGLDVLAKEVALEKQKTQASDAKAKSKALNAGLNKLSPTQRLNAKLVVTDIQSQMKQVMSAFSGLNNRPAGVIADLNARFERLKTILSETKSPGMLRKLRDEAKDFSAHLSKLQSQAKAGITNQRKMAQATAQQQQAQVNAFDTAKRLAKIRTSRLSTDVKDSIATLKQVAREGKARGLTTVFDVKNLPQAQRIIAKIQKGISNAKSTKELKRHVKNYEKIYRLLTREAAARSAVIASIKGKEATEKAVTKQLEEQLNLQKKFEQSLEKQRRQSALVKSTELAKSSDRVLNELRRQAEGFGTLGKAIQIPIEVLGFRKLEKLRTEIRLAFAKGNIAGAERLTASLRRLNTIVKVVHLSMLALRAALAAARAAMQALKAAFTFGLSIFTKITGMVFRLGQAIVSVPFGVFKTGMKLLFAPTLAVVRLLRRMVGMFDLIFGGLVVYQVKQAIEAMSEFEDVLGRATGNLGIIGDDFAAVMDDMKSVAVQVARETAISVEQVALGLEELARGGVLDPYKDAATKVKAALVELQNTARLSLISGIDTGEVAKLVSIVRNQFGLVGDEMDDLADSMAFLQKLGPITLNDIRTAVEGSGAAAKNAGISWEEYNGVLAALMRNLRSGSRAATAISRSLVQSIVKPLSDDKAIARLKTLRIDMSRFLDASGQKFREGGFTAFVEALIEAKAGLGDLQEIFDFRSREFINLLTTDMASGSSSIAEFTRQIKEAQGTNFAEKFAEEIRDKTFFGALRSAKNELEIMKLTILELGRASLIPFIVNVRKALEKITDFIDGSVELRAIFGAISEKAIALGKALQPILNRFLKIAALLNTVLIAAVVRLTTVVAEKLEPVFKKVTGKIAEYLGAPAAVMEDWTNVLALIAVAIKNIDQVGKIALVQMKIFAYDAALLLLKGLEKINPFSSLVEKLNVVVDPLLKSVSTIGLFVGSTLAASITAGLKKTLVADPINNTLANFLESRAASEKSLVKRIGIQKLADAFRSADNQIAGERKKIDAELQASIVQNVAKLKQGLADAGLGEALSNIRTDGFEAMKSSIEEARDELIKLREEMGGALDLNYQEEIDKLNEAIEKMRKLDDLQKKTPPQPREFGQAEDAKTPSASTGRIADFHNLLQQGDDIQRRAIRVQEEIRDAIEEQNRISMDQLRELFGLNEKEKTQAAGKPF